MLSPRTSKRLQLIVAIAAVLAMVFQYDLAAALWVLVIFPFFGIAVSAWLLALDALVALVRRKTAWHLVSAAMLAMCLGPAIRYVYPPFDWLAAAQMLVRHESHYSELVQRADAGQVVDEIYRTEEGLLRLYMFVWGAWGPPDHCYGVVHDESRTFDGATEKVLSGDLVYEVHLWGAWYFAQFT